jgi:cytochrome oxidase Cu insertion factor (SCO1/SenC/PrrC family)
MTWIVLVTTAGTAHAQSRGQQGTLAGAPSIGEALPEVQLYLADGTPFSTSQLKGSYSVLVFGCLT